MGPAWPFAFSVPSIEILKICDKIMCIISNNVFMDPPSEILLRPIFFQEYHISHI